MRVLTLFKKLTILAFAGLVVSMLSVSNVQAFTNTQEYYLRQILENTQKILIKVNDVPTELKNLVTLVGQLKVSLLAEDDSEGTANMQQQFSLLGNLIAASYDSRSTNQMQMMATILGVPASQLGGDKPQILEKVPNLNDLTYSTLLGQPMIRKAPANPTNYLNNISGASIRHAIPSSTWQGSQESQLKYWGYFNTVISIESYNGYMLAKQYASNQGGQNLTQTQVNLIKEASGANWMQTIASEEIGKVLRQLLMFQSQTYVLLSRFMQNQQDLVTAQLMTNTLLILNNQMNEGLMASNAQGVQPNT